MMSEKCTIQKTCVDTYVVVHEESGHCLALRSRKNPTNYEYTKEEAEAIKRQLKDGSLTLNDFYCEGE